ncbi:oxidoreductase [Acetobacter estunensis NRIC 0472]|uniref:Pyridine nucleotide-disulfide oxidoreductase n=1 Tax=Acetobacter estunensis TaxID=104097 RepID=A0A967ECG4_9PROT|nr:FAD/NAD(P)-binding oxidoreductase [Acetobacter estunensis]MBV1835754.1 NAD(P)/FAD-dependent oxidoreductase [Acetobacter estunensis]MBV1835985.1 NAD(P)/FAD-dependent oxidoreductase [Acetobacter estunensis]NHO54578.1 pyridine nucleotide-disulfide oxidoreductase [Acetobacter estunensis]GBQ26720.1 oxidoreductase [Acetobacter estunensis NRIC 0472]
MSETTPAQQPDKQFTILIVGGGAAGIAVAARLRRERPSLSVGVIDPSTTHAYQPGWTLVGAGVMTLRETLRQEGGLIPNGVTWLRASAQSFQPDEHVVTLDDGQRIGYRRLILCPGLQLDWDKIEGLSETLGSNGVCSNYSMQHVEYTWTCIQTLNGGKALFTQPPMPIKCAGAPQKIVYLASDYWRKEGTLNRTEVNFFLAGDALFGVAYFRPSLQYAVDYYGVNLNYKHNLVAVDGPARLATFEVTAGDGTKTRETHPFDMLHVTPPQSAPNFIKASPFADENGWVNVDPSTLQHKTFDTVFGLGDVIGTSNAKTAAAVRAQTPVVVGNVLASLEGKPLQMRYDGYGACPLTVSYGKVVLAEFLYGGKPAPSFPYDQRKPSRFAWFLKTQVFPRVYWDMMLTGRDINVPHHPDWVKNAG